MARTRLFKWIVLLSSLHSLSIARDECTTVPHKATLPTRPTQAKEATTSRTFRPRGQSHVTSVLDLIVCPVISYFADCAYSRNKKRVAINFALPFIKVSVVCKCVEYARRQGEARVLRWERKRRMLLL